MGDNTNEIIQEKGALAAITLSLIGDILSALAGTIELQETRDISNTQKLEVAGDWLVVTGDIIELWLLLREQIDDDTFPDEED